MKPRPIPSQYLISVQQPELWLLSAFGLLLAIVLLCWGFYESGRESGGYDRTTALDKEEILNGRIDELIAENRSLLRRNATVVHDQKINQDANSEVKKSLVDAQDKIINMKEELAFYRSIVSPGNNKRSVNLQKISLAAEENGQFRYKIVTTQRGRNDRVARGTVELAIQGNRDGVSEWLSMKQLTASKIAALKFRFKYFQNFEGVLIIPAGFEPSSLRVRLNPRSSGIEKVEEVFAWTDLNNRGKASNVGQQQQVQTGQN